MMKESIYLEVFEEFGEFLKEYDLYCTKKMR